MGVKLNHIIPIIAEVTEAAIIPTLAICLNSSSLKARSEINIDMVNPIPAKKATPRIWVQFTPSGNEANLNYTTNIENIVMPSHLPKTRPAIIPNDIGCSKRSITFPSI